MKIEYAGGAGPDFMSPRAPGSIFWVSFGDTIGGGLRTCGRILFGWGLATCSLQSVVYGQERTRRRGGAETIPEIGSLIPELSVLDAEGNRFALRKKLEGRHAVIVFGCLT